MVEAFMKMVAAVDKLSFEEMLAVICTTLEQQCDKRDKDIRDAACYMVRAILELNGTEERNSKEAKDNY